MAYYTLRECSRQLGERIDRVRDLVRWHRIPVYRRPGGAICLDQTGYDRLRAVAEAFRSLEYAYAS